MLWLGRHVFRVRVVSALRLLVDIIVTIAWAALAFVVLRALLILWTTNRRIAGLSAAGIAAAFVLGTMSPFVFSRPASGPDTPAAASPAASTTPVVGAVVQCSVGAVIGRSRAGGNIDQITNAAGIIPPSSKVALTSGASIHFVGWAVIGNAPAQSACIAVDGKVVASTGSYGLDRPDVARAFKVPALEFSGFSVGATLVPGVHHVSVVAVSSSGAIAAFAPPITVNVP